MRSDISLNEKGIAAIALFIIMSLLLSGCSIEPIIEKNYIYNGESKSWTGEYKLDYIVDFPIEDGAVYANKRENRTLIG